MVLACSHYYCGGFLLVIFYIYLFFYINWNFMRKICPVSPMYLFYLVIYVIVVSWILIHYYHYHVISKNLQEVFLNSQ